MPLIEYTEPRIHVCRGSYGVEFEFHPGAENEVPTEVWENLKKHSGGCKTLIDQNKLKVVTIRSAVVPGATKKDGHSSDSVSELDKMPDKRVAGKPKAIGEEAGPPKEIESLSELDVGTMTSFDAIGLVERIYTESLLERFRGQEEKRRGGPRKTVIAALDGQLAIMRTEPAQSSGGQVTDG